MKDQLKLLLALQNIDLALDETQQEIERIQRQLHEHKEIHGKLSEDLSNQKLQLEETRALKNARQEELREAEERYNKSKERLMSVSSAKEYNALEKEMDQLKRKSEETREQLDHLKDQIELNERAIEEKEAKINDLGAQIESAEKEAEGDLARLDQKIKDTTQQRKDAQKDIKVHIFRRYDFIRSRRGGTAVVPASDGHCEGCFMRTPPQLFIEVQRGNTLVTCPSCQRILFHAESMENEQEAAV